ncbi:MAG: DUF2975 domain-containing protein [Pseudonocardiales bacterium]|jgi:hypothetical protein|nr:DUF2975 domain-containing protein [Pseudonocardiales bacterium]
MLTMRRAVVPLGVLLVLLFAVVTAGLVAALVNLLPRVPELLAGVLPLGWTLLAIAVPGLLCVLVVIACTGRLLAMVARDRIFSADALPWVDGILWAIAAGWVFFLGAGVPVFVIAELDDAPGLAALHLLILLVGAVIGLLMVVMRALLHQATSLRTDLEAVI